MSKMKDLYIDICELLEAGMSDEGIAEQLDIPIRFVIGARHQYLEYESARSEVDEF